MKKKTIIKVLEEIFLKAGAYENVVFFLIFNSFHAAIFDCRGGLNENQLEAARQELLKSIAMVASDQGGSSFYYRLLQMTCNNESYRIGAIAVKEDGSVEILNEVAIGDPAETEYTKNYYFNLINSK